MDAKLDRYHRPERSLIVSGISRSGTSLLSVLLNAVDNVVCFNEVLPPEPERLPEALARVRRDLLTRKAVRNKFDDAGHLTTDTLSEMVKKKTVVKKHLNDDVCVATKRNIPYLNEAEALIALGYPMVVMIRDPVYTLGSWGSPKAVAAAIPGARVAPGEVHAHWHRVRFSRQDVVERRAEAWQHYAARIWELRDRVRIVHYEDLCARPHQALAGLCRWAVMPAAGDLPDIVRSDCNRDDRYTNLSRIRDAVSELCPAREHFGYA